MVSRRAAAAAVSQEIKIAIPPVFVFFSALGGPPASDDVELYVGSDPARHRCLRGHGCTGLPDLQPGRRRTPAAQLSACHSTLSQQQPADLLCK